MIGLVYDDHDGAWSIFVKLSIAYAGGLTCNIIHYDIFLQLYGMSCKTC